MTADLQQMASAVDGAARQCRLGLILVRHDQRFTGIRTAQCDRQGAADRAEGAGEGELGAENDVLQAARRKLVRCHEDAQCDGQVEPRAILGQIGGCEVDGDATSREFEPAGGQRAADAIPRLAHGGIGQADNGEGRQPASEVNLNADPRRIDTDRRPGLNQCQ